MWSRIGLLKILASIFFLLSFPSILFSDPAKGPLSVCRDNPRYFTDGSGKAVYLTGSHVWNNLVDMGPHDPPPVFNFEKYIAWMQERNHNFIRLWCWEPVSWNTKANGENKRHFVEPHPWLRTGPENALDGKPKFDLAQFNPEYFKRLRERVQYAGERGIYVSVMLFEGWGLQFVENALQDHPFHQENNVNGIHGDRDGDGKGLEIHELVVREITAVQEAYVKKIIDTINDLDNVLYEISNENHPPSTAWQYHMIDFIHQVEKGYPKQHPVGMTFQYKGGSNQVLFDSPADWISPNPEGGYNENPPANDGKKVILNDTDHLWGIGGNRAWVWKSFCRGHNPLFMDPYDGLILGNKFDPQWDPIRRSLGDTRRVADRVDLTTMIPQNDLASSGYCLAEPGEKYVVFFPEGEEGTVELSSCSDLFTVEWLNPENSVWERGEDIKGGGNAACKSPFGKTHSVLILQKKADG